MSCGTGTCPFCGGMTYFEEVDIGVGFQQVAPAECPSCGAQQDYEGRWMSAAEVEKGMEEFVARLREDSK